MWTFEIIDTDRDLEYKDAQTWNSAEEVIPMATATLGHIYGLNTKRIEFSKCPNGELIHEPTGIDVIARIKKIVA